MSTRKKYESKITVLCHKCGKRHYEDDVEIANIYSDMQERDVVTFDCPSCGNHVESHRFG